jgi:hypothetical protein
MWRLSPTALVAVFIVSLTACEREPMVRPLDDVKRSPQPAEHVRYYPDSTAIKNAFHQIALISFPSLEASVTDSVLVERARPHAAKFGANGVVILHRGQKVRDVLALDVTNQPKPCRGVWAKLSPTDSVCANVGIPTNGMTPVLKDDPALRNGGVLPNVAPGSSPPQGAVPVPAGAVAEPASSPRPN